ncbi:Cell division control protein 45 CDC45 [Entamoeba marina]
MIINNTSFVEIYNSIRNKGKQKKSIQLFVAPTVDAIACYKILSSLFELDGLLHSAIPVNNYDNLRRSFKEMISHSDVHTVFFIDCGGSINLRELIGEQEDLDIYIIDSHRPYHDSNIRDESISLLTNSEYLQFEDNETQPVTSDYLEADDDLLGINESDLGNFDLVRKLVHSDGEFYSESVARVAFGFTEQLKKSSINFEWYALIGISDQYISSKINAQTYLHAIQYFITPMNREVLPITELLQHVKSPLCVKMDCQLMLLRHWTLYDSIFHTREIASRLGIWNSKGKEKFDVLIADMGIPITQAKQGYRAMALEMKTKFLTRMESYSKHYHFENLFLPSFFKRYGSDYSISSFDAAHAIAALITNDDPKHTWQQQFWEGFKLLSSTNSEMYQVAFEKCIDSNKNLVETGIILLLSKGIINESNKYRFLCVSDGLISSKFKSPYKALQLAQFLSEASSRRYKKTLPFVLSILNGEKNTFTIVGYRSPISIHTQNYFGDKFTRTAESMNIPILQKNFDSFVTEIHRDNFVKYKKALKERFEIV